MQCKAAFALFIASTQVLACTSLQIGRQRAARRTTPVQARGKIMASLVGKTDVKVGIIGASGAVGREIISVLEKRDFPCGAGPVCFGSKGGKKVPSAKWGTLETVTFSEEALKDFDVCFLAVSGEFAEKHAANIAAQLKEGGIVVDNSSALRYKDDIPLCIPEVNGEECKGAKVVANPNCTTAIALMALYPLFVAFGLKKVIMSTYQAASGAGKEGMLELRSGVAKLADEGAGLVADDGCFSDAAKANAPDQVFSSPLPFNVIPHIDKFQANGYTKEEMKVTWETRKLLGYPPFDETSAAPKVSCTAVRIPTLRAHSEAITIETEKPITPDAAREVLNKAQGIRVVDDTANNKYPMPLTSTGDFDVEVGRIRSNPVFGDTGLDFFICGDQLLRGAALNAVLIAEYALA